MPIIRSPRDSSIYDRTTGAPFFQEEAPVVPTVHLLEAIMYTNYDKALEAAQQMAQRDGLWIRTVQGDSVDVLWKSSGLHVLANSLIPYPYYNILNQENSKPGKRGKMATFSSRHLQCVVALAKLSSAEGAEWTKSPTQTSATGFLYAFPHSGQSRGWD